MRQWIQKARQVPVVAHGLATFERFSSRLGWQFAAAITYFSVLSIVPILMVAFAALGFTITVFFPDLIGTIDGWILDTFSGQGELGDELLAVVDDAFRSWQAVGVIGLISAAWAGARWVANLGAAVRGQMRAELDLSQRQVNMVVQTIRNLGILFTLLVLLLLTGVISTAATAAREAVLSLLGIDPLGGNSPLLWLIPVAASLLADFLLFVFMFRVFPERPVPTSTLLKGAAMGSVGFAALQHLAGILIRVFAGNAAAAVFGGVIVVMLFLNLFATLILVIAAWMATHPDDAVATSPVVADAQPRQPTDYATKLLAAALAAPEPDKVPTEVAVRATRIGISAGALAGATLAGLIAAAASVAEGLRERRA